ncbi:hypothetical protein LB505_011697 [Fusarium chuoi]|nr:hypothetical protein LB505_011697 [Fusarium chuoi]
MKVFSFVAANPVNSFNSDVKQFFNYLANSQNYPASKQYLLINSGSNAKLTVTNFNAHVN